MGVGIDVELKLPITLWGTYDTDKDLSLPGSKLKDLLNGTSNAMSELATGFAVYMSRAKRSDHAILPFKINAATCADAGSITSNAPVLDG